MAGGITTPKCVAMVSENGGLGSLPLGYLTVAQAIANIRETKQLTAKPFAINIFVTQEVDISKNQDRINIMKRELFSYRASIGLSLENNPTHTDEASIDDLISIAISEKVSAFSFTFGSLSTEQIKKLKESNIFVIGTATTIREGILLQQLGCNAVVGQGYEAGGHRGTFLGSPQSSQIGTMALIPQLATALNIPVIAAGGIMNGQGLVAALSLGATAVQMGTAFLTCQESGTNSFYRETILNSTEESTVMTPYFTGKLARGIKNRFTEEMEEKCSTDNIPDYPIQHYLTQEMRRESAKKGVKDYSSFWAGQGTRLNRKDITVKELLEKIEKEAKETVNKLYGTPYSEEVMDTKKLRSRL